jgi:hypothetical protein
MARKSKTSPSLDDVLRQAIADRGVPLTRIAEGSGVPLPVLSRYMAGVRDRIRTDTANKLMQFLDLEVRRK